MNKAIKVSYRCDDKFYLSIDNKEYYVDFPEFNSFSLADVIGSNLSLMYSYHLGIIKNKPVKYNSTIPRFQSQILKNILYDLPSCEVEDQNLTMETLLKRFFNLKPEYEYPYVENGKITYPYDVYEDKVTLAFSFG